MYENQEQNTKCKYLKNSNFVPKRTTCEVESRGGMVSEGSTVTKKPSVLNQENQDVLRISVSGVSKTLTRVAKV